MKNRNISFVSIALVTALCLIPATRVEAQIFEPRVEYDVVVERPTDVAIADLNGDGHPDLAATCVGWVENVSVLLGNGDGTFQPAVDYGTGEYPRALAVADLNGDGIPDMAAGNGGGDVSVLLGNGDGTFQPAVSYVVGGVGDIATGDLDGDGDIDIAVVTWDSNSVLVLLGNGDGTFLTIPGQTFDVSCNSVAIGDLDQDGIEDLVVGSMWVDDDERVFVLLGNGDATFQTPTIYDSGDDGYHDVAIGDLNNDGIPDLAMSIDASVSVSVLLGNGDGTFQTAITYEDSRWPCSVTIGDLDGDGNQDLVTTGQGGDGTFGTTAVRLGNGDGTFLPPLYFLTNYETKAAATGDLDGDGNQDLAVACFGDDNLSVFLNTGLPVSLFTDFTCTPMGGTVPFYTRMKVTLLNRVPDQSRLVAARLQVELANGQLIDSWKSGYQNMAAGTQASTSWYQRIPALISLIGKNRLTLFVEDVTPAPWNLPPYPKSGYRAESGCIVCAGTP